MSSSSRSRSRQPRAYRFSPMRSTRTTSRSPTLRTLRARSRPCTCSRRDSSTGLPACRCGFEPDFLPTFAPPPSDLTNLRVLYGSCRRPGHPTVDALALVDDLIFDHDKYKDARTRPHQLFLGGDQIYADDVLMLHMLLVEAAAVPLIGSTGSAEFPTRSSSCLWIRC